MTAQERGMTAIAAVVRQMTPPQLEAVILFYPPQRPEQMSSIIATSDPQRMLAPAQEKALERARRAAKAFMATPVNTPCFNPQS